MATVTEYAGGASGTSWTNPTNANADDGAYATYTIAAKNTTGNENTLSNFGFDSSIPANSLINSVQLEVEHKVSTNGGIANLEAAVAISSTVGTFNTDSAEPTTDTARTYSSLARPGGGSWTRADLLDGTFTVRLRARSGNNATSVVYSWDYARVTVDYTAPSTGSGTLAAQASTVSGAGQSAWVGTGALSSGVSSVTGSGSVANSGSTGTGVLVAGASSVDGSESPPPATTGGGGRYYPHGYWEAPKYVPPIKKPFKKAERELVQKASISFEQLKRVIAETDAEVLRESGAYKEVLEQLKKRRRALFLLLIS